MILNNQKGEMLIETVVSLLILVLSLAMVTQMMMVSRGMMLRSSESAQIFAEQQQVAELKDTTAAGVTGTEIDMGISLTVNSATRTETQEGLSLFATEKGILFFAD